MQELNQPKRVLITGCSSGFGRHMVDHFLAGGWDVFATTRHPERFASDKGNPRLHILPYNIASPTGREQVVRAITDFSPKQPGLDCLINNAGYGLAGPLEALSDSQIRQQFEVNFFAPLFLIRALLPSLHESRGRIINISSVLGFTGMPMQSLYAASKFALEGLTESLHYELASHGVQVTLVEPGGFRTGFAEGMDFPGDIQAFPKYNAQFQGYRNFLRKVSTVRKGEDPKQVSRVIFRLAQRKTLSLRVRVGKDCQALYYLKKTLPQRVADGVLRTISRRILEAK